MSRRGRPCRPSHSPVRQTRSATAASPALRLIFLFDFNYLASLAIRRSSDELGEVRLGLSNADRLHACSPESRPDRVQPYARIGDAETTSHFPTGASLQSRSRAARRRPLGVR